MAYPDDLDPYDPIDPASHLSSMGGLLHTDLHQKHADELDVIKETLGVDPAAADSASLTDRLDDVESLQSGVAVAELARRYNLLIDWLAGMGIPLPIEDLKLPTAP